MTWRRPPTVDGFQGGPHCKKSRIIVAIEGAPAEKIKMSHITAFRGYFSKMISNDSHFGSIVLSHRIQQRLELVHGLTNFVWSAKFADDFVHVAVL